MPVKLWTHRQFKEAMHGWPFRVLMGLSYNSRPAGRVSSELRFAEELDNTGRQRPSLCEPEAGERAVGHARFFPSKKLREKADPVQQAGQIRLIWIHIGDLFCELLGILSNLPRVCPGLRDGMLAVVAAYFLKWSVARCA